VTPRGVVERRLADPRVEEDLRVLVDGRQGRTSCQ
jgi:hypothetical protein